MLLGGNFETLSQAPRFSTRRLVLGFLVIVAAALIVVYKLFAGAPELNAEPERWVISQSQKTAVTIHKLQEEGFIKNEWIFSTLYHARGKLFIEPGGYTISKSMNAGELARVFAQGPEMKWVIIPEGLRKEEIADILAKALGWSTAQKEQWITVDTAQKTDYTEGVFFPDTYLIDRAEEPARVAQRFIERFQEQIEPLAQDGLKKKIKWQTIVKLASIIEREAAGESDMPLIAGVLWNRLDKKMRLQVDATLQYARGDVGKGWWAPVSPADKEIDSPYNTYLRAGLPPTAISNPGLAALSAVVNFEKTNCLFYLHDSDKQIHCAKTYIEHKQNIEKYLK
jgi:UPF0755 protein